ncbi:hypothetical protein GCM10009555_064980 [Acrocarpospora macrocephala]|uniref:IclR family transcriptional regulator n=1 Tax=Acrocarpospora macrocephala TaxID=150177 RepID=A0A5M3WZH1_9ACTN|nr:helix-turn-helix domain-containing protein [Acrocarpospora macrocephala]GES14895.1 hypothetical protein Amac_084920 [Acrocarpospora macrocephala]
MSPSFDGHIRSVRRGLAALDLLVAAAPNTVRVVDVAEHLEVDQGTASRMLATLVESGYASRTPDRRFTVGPRSLPMATHWISRLRNAAAAPMARVSRATGEIVLLSQLLGSQDVPIAYLPGRDGDRHGLTAGFTSTYPLWATASGRALLSRLSPANQVQLLPPEPYPRLTPRTTSDWQGLRDTIREGSKRRVYIEQDEVIAGFWCAFVPLERCVGGELLAMGVVVRGELSGRQRARILNTLAAETRDLGFALTA